MQIKPLILTEVFVILKKQTFFFHERFFRSIYRFENANLVCLLPEISVNFQKLLLAIVTLHSPSCTYILELDKKERKVETFGNNF